MLRDIMEFRLLIEPQVAYLAAKHITGRELDRLKIIVCDQDRKNLAGEDDSEFHLQLAETSRNKVIQEVFSTLHGILNESRSELLRSDTRRRASVGAHPKIIDALERKDPAMAFQVMKEHLSKVEQIIFGSNDGTEELNNRE